MGGTKLLHDTLMRFADAKTEVSFGLRKTGKTSFLFKIDRIIREQHLGFVFFMIASLHHTENFTGTSSLEKYVAM